jgi:hypothetical protein
MRRLALFVCVGCGQVSPLETSPVAPLLSGRELDLRSTRVAAPAPFIPAQCYARTTVEDGTPRNPCWTCHQKPRAPNFVDDSELQLALDMPAPAAPFPWTNLRAAAQVMPSADEILAWVREDNWHDDDGAISLARSLADLPAGWDADADGVWDGFVPDLWLAADTAGWDHAPDGTATGWRSYAYTPLPGVFWPTNGGWGDAWIRLPPAYREDATEVPDLGVATRNLDLVEALVQRTAAIDGWAPREGRLLRWAGRAGKLQDDGLLEPPTPGLLPVGTELAHSVRYVEPTESGVRSAARLKEMRYARKTTWQSWSDTKASAADEAKERFDFPDRLKTLHGDVEHGVFTGRGWLFQGFVEDALGELRPQTFEETAWCVGCHGGIAATTDGTFSLARKQPGDAGWRHDDVGLYGVPDLLRADGRGEAALYLETTRSGDDFQANDDIRTRFFPGGTLDPVAVAALEHDLSPLVLPSGERALALAATTMSVVRSQAFSLGREPVRALTDTQVWTNVPIGEPTGWSDPVAPGFVPSP